MSVTDADTAITGTHDATGRCDLAGIKYRRGYFVSQEEQDAVIGRVVRELSAVKNKAAALTVEAHRIGAGLVELGTTLGGTPEQVAKLAANNQSVSMRFQPVKLFDATLLDGSKLAQLLDDLRASLSDMQKLSEDATRLGV